jgi:adenylate cyclase
LQANYILAGSYTLEAGTISLELAEAKSGVFIWGGSLKDRVASIIGPDHNPIDQLVADIRATIAIREVQRARTQSLPNLQGYTLLMAALTLMHRLSLHDSEESHHLSLTLTDRARRQPLPQAWLAKWHVLRVQQGWSPDTKQDAREALQCTRRALDSDPDCSLALRWTASSTRPC